MGSPFYGTLLDCAARAYTADAELREALERHVERSRIGLRLAGAAHFRALAGDAPGVSAHYPSTGGDGDARGAWAAIHADLFANKSTYDTLLARPVQTNEVARALPVLAAMLAISHAKQMPLRVFEIGSSAGLILNFDRYRYTGEGWAWGDPDAALELTNGTREGVPAHLNADLEIAQRRGCDLHPLDAADSVDRDTLLGFVWPDQTARFERLRRALEVARSYPVAIDAANGIDWLSQVAQPAPGAVTVVLHTVITEHMPPQDRERFRARIRRLGAEATVAAPFAWARMETAAAAYETTVSLWPSQEELVIARSDGHAQALEWNVQTA